MIFEYNGVEHEIPDNLTDEQKNAALMEIGLPPLTNQPAQNSLKPTAMQEFGAIVSGIPQNLLTGLAEAGSATGRSLAQGLDFLTSPLQALDNATGDRVGTFESGYESYSDWAGSPTGGYMQPGVARDVIRGAGGAAPAALGMAPVFGRNIATPMGALAEFAGLGGARAPQASVAMPLLDPAQPPAPVTARLSDYLPERTKTSDIKNLIALDPENVGRLGKEIDPFTGGLVTNKAANSSVKQGLKENLVSMVQASTGSTKQKMLNMLDIVEKGKTNLRETINRPGDIIGDSLLDRYRVVKAANKQGGQMINTAAKDLKGKPVDVSPAVNSFMDDLQELGVQFDPGAGTVSFRGSDIEKITGEETAFKNLLERMLNTDNPDAYDVHRLKRFIDNTVTYGKRVEGVSGNTERIMKRLRNGLDSILDAQFPQYAKANQQYSETIGALDDLQTLAGRKADLSGMNADKDIGILLRRILSNARSRVPIMDNIVEMDRVANKYKNTGKDIAPYGGVLSGDSVAPTAFDDDILTQALFADELERVFGTNATTSFMGDIGKSIQRGAVDTAVTGGNPWTSASELVHSGIDRLRGVNEENALKEFRRLLEQQ